MSYISQQQLLKISHVENKLLEEALFGSRLVPYSQDFDDFLKLWLPISVVLDLLFLNYLHIKEEISICIDMRGGLEQLYRTLC